MSSAIDTIDDHAVVGLNAGFSADVAAWELVREFADVTVR